MPNKHRLIYVAILSALATACSTGSNLNTGNHHPTTNIPGTDGKDNTSGNEPAKTNFDTITNSEVQKANTDDGKTEKLEFGFNFATPITGYAVGDTTVNTAANIDASKAKIDDSENYDTITFINDPSAGEVSETTQISIKKDEWKGKAGVINYKDYVVTDLPKGVTRDNIDYFFIEDSDGLKLVQFENTKIGSLLRPSGADYYGNLFYKGKNPSKAIPTSGTATYHGVWDTAQALTADTGITLPTNEKLIGSRQLSMAPVELTADFGKKILTGDLKANEIRKKFAYAVDAKIHGNTFSGTATSTDNENGATISDTATVSGGFFGNQASELAGKLIGKKAAGVFAAKQTSNDNLVNGKEQPPVIYNQAKAITADSKADNIFATNFTEVLAGTEKLPNIDKITINGVEIDLLNEVKKSPSSVFGNENSLPLQFTRIGEVVDKNKQSSFFYQGQLTQTMPTTGKATYEGNWIGYGKSEKGTQFSMKKDLDAKINFTADFAKKALTGKFLSPAGVDAMTLDNVKITGNTFAGKANIEGRGLVNDKDGVQDRIKGTVNVSGGFFGDKANELGGQFSKDDKNFAGVFAGKKVADK